MNQPSTRKSWKKSDAPSTGSLESNEKTEPRKQIGLFMGAVGPPGSGDKFAWKEAGRKRGAPEAQKKPVVQWDLQEPQLAHNSLSVRKLSRVGRVNVSGKDISRNTGHIQQVRELSDLRKAARSGSLGKSQDTPEVLKTRPLGTPNVILDPAAFLARVESLRDREPEGETLGRWRAVGARAAALPPPETTKARAFQLRDKARQIHPLRSCSDCGFRPVGEVALMRRPDGAHTIGGVHTCGSVWSCPVCALRIKGQRAEQVKRGVELHRLHHGPHSLALLSLTIRHGADMSLAWIADGYQRAHDDFFRLVPEVLKRSAPLNHWREVCGLEPIKWREHFGFVGYISGTETTYGRRNGWHYHRHYLMAFRANRSEGELSELAGYLRAHWRACVERHLGEECAPDDEHGLDLRTAHQAEYISKLGLEISDVGTKQARPGNVTQWGLLDATYRGSGEALEALGEYVYAMKGRKCVQLSERLKAHWEKLGAVLTDDQDDADDSKGAELVAEISRGEWMRLRMSGSVIAFLARADAGYVALTMPDDPGWGDGSRVERDAIEERVPKEPPEERRTRLARELLAFYASLTPV